MSIEITCGCGKNINKLQIRLGRAAAQRSANMFIGTIKSKMICMICQNSLQPHFTPEHASLRTLDEWRNYMVGLLEDIFAKLRITITTASAYMYVLYGAGFRWVVAAGILYAFMALSHAQVIC